MSETKNITNNLRRVNKLAEILDLEKFYSISFTEYEISLQGFYDNRIVRELQAKKFKATVSENGYTQLKRGALTITFT